MMRYGVPALCLAVVAAAGPPALAQDEQGRSPARMTLSIRKDVGTDPTQAGALAAGARAAEAQAAQAEAQAAEDRARQRARQLSHEALTQRDTPLHRFGVLSGPLAPTTPGRIRR